MEEVEIANSPCGLTLKEVEHFITINNSPFLYSISKLEKGDGIKIKLFESKPKTNIYYEYEALTQELTNSIKFLVLCEDLDEMIIALKSAFDEERAKFVEESNKYFIEFKFEAMGKSKKNKIELIKYQPKNPIDELNEKITMIQNDYKNLYKEIEELKKGKNDSNVDIKDKMKEILKDKELRMSLYNEFEQIMCSKFNLSKETKKGNKEKTPSENSETTISEFNKKLRNIEEKFKEKTNDINKIRSLIDNIRNNNKTETNISSEIDKHIQNNQLIKDISNDVNSLKNNLNNNNQNYIQMKIYSNEYEKIKILQQNNAYKYLSNFERDDLELIIDGKNSSLDIFERTNEFKEEEKSKNCYKAQRIEYNLKTGFSFFVKFETKGFHTIQIFFKKKLYDCGFLFNNCKNIYEIDLSNFDCSQVTSCESMFDGCVSLEKINLGKSDFSFCKSFKSMFNNCENLENIDVSFFNTKNSTSFEKMFCGCKKLAKIDVSKFDSSKCNSIFSMFRYCEKISEIDMINWDMSHLEKRYNFLSSIYPGLGLARAGIVGEGILGAVVGAGMLAAVMGSSGTYALLNKVNSINYLFDGCKDLKTIKMSSNFGDIDLLINENEKNEVFTGLPKNGNFYWKDGINCDKLLSHLPVGWNRYTI